MTRVVADYDSYGNIIGYHPLSREQKSEAKIKLRQLITTLKQNGYVRLTKKAIRIFGECKELNYINGLSDYTIYESIKDIMK